MNFKIQACNPKTQNPAERRVEDLAAAIQAIFAADTEDAFLLWNGIPVRLSYKYDLSVLIDDLLPLLAKLLDSPTGAQQVYWASNTFQAEWALEWTADQVTIIATWDSVAGGYEDLLNQRNMLEVERKGFLREWRAVLRHVLDKVNKANLEIEDQSSIDLLRKIEAALPSVRSLYAA